MPLVFSSKLKQFIVKIVIHFLYTVKQNNDFDKLAVPTGPIYYRKNF